VNNRCNFISEKQVIQWHNVINFQCDIRMLLFLNVILICYQNWYNCFIERGLWRSFANEWSPIACNMFCTSKITYFNLIIETCIPLFPYIIWYLMLFTSVHIEIKIYINIVMNIPKEVAGPSMANVSLNFIFYFSLKI
jgi:hypothetical protein